MNYKYLITFVLCLLPLFGVEFKVASYNVENLFDMKYEGTEYTEYIPKKNSQWNNKNYQIKLKNTAKVIQELNAEVIALQEVESKRVLTALLKKLPQYPYSLFTKNEKSAIGLAIISKYKIISHEKISIKSRKAFRRPIQKIKLNIEGNTLFVFNNHWPSKRAKESERIEYALSLKNHLRHKDIKGDYILIGDFNSNYDEYQSIIHNKKLNDTHGYTGINQVLNTSIDKQFIRKETIFSHQDMVHYNLWLDKNYSQRYSYKFRNQNSTPDNILLSKSLFDQNGISYINQSFKVSKPDYLFNKEHIYRWQIRGKNKIHQGRGYSDHLPIYASFSTEKYLNSTEMEQNQDTSIESLYKRDYLIHTRTIKAATVIYKINDSVIIKQKNNRAIYIYEAAKNLILGKQYDLEILEIKNYNGLHEVTKINILKEKNSEFDFPSFYTEGQEINLSDKKFQNEIIKNLHGIYKKGYLHYMFKNKDKKIKLYAKDSSFLPKNGQKITIITGHLAFYKSKAQIVIYKESDFSVN